MSVNTLHYQVGVPSMKLKDVVKICEIEKCELQYVFIV